MSEPKKHHYVPQCYQRRFSADGVNIKYFDKKAQQGRVGKIEEFCQIEYLYYLSHSPSPYYLERDFFAKCVDDKLSKHLIYFDSIDYRNVRVEFNLDKKKSIAKQMLLQYMRTPQYRNTKYQYEIDAYCLQINYLLHKIGIETETMMFIGDAPEFHKRRLCDNQETDDIINEIASAHWELLHSQCYEFYTSDNPVAVKERLDMPVGYCDAIKYFDDIYYPLNSNLLLHVATKKADSKRDIPIKEITNKEEVSQINDIIKSKAQQYIVYKNQYE